MSVEVLQRVVNEATRVVGNITPDQLANPTPCAEWTVRDVVNHITGGSTMFAISAEQGSVPDDVLGKLMGGGDNLGSDYKAAWATASTRAMSAFDGLDLEKIVALPFGEMPAAIALNIAIFDVTIHATELATSTGQEIVDTDLLETALQLAQAMIGPELRQPGVFGPEQPCPADAPVTQRLLAFSGRSV